MQPYVSLSLFAEEVIRMRIKKRKTSVAGLNSVA